MSGVQEDEERSAEGQKRKCVRMTLCRLLT